MKYSFEKLHLVLLVTEYKLTALTGNWKAQQDSLEKLVLFRTHLRVEKEQSANKLLFNTL